MHVYVSGRMLTSPFQPETSSFMTPIVPPCMRKYYVLPYAVHPHLAMKTVLLPVVDSL